MIYIPLVALLVMFVCLLVFKKYWGSMGPMFKVFFVLFVAANLFFCYWGPHVAKEQSGFAEWGDVWYIIVVAVGSMIFTLSCYTAKANQIR